MALAAVWSRLSSLNRARRIAQAFARHGFGSVVDQLGFSDGSLAEPAADELRTARLGRRLALTLGELGPVWIKLGQLLATREDVLPAAVTAELAALQDRVAPLPTGMIVEQVAVALGRSDLAGWSIRAQPLASASIAQVHRARLPDGREVVVKVQRPGLAAVVDEDLALLDTIAATLDERVEDARRFDPRGLVREFGAGLRRELDFALEAESARRMRALARPGVRVPEVVDAMSRGTVLTLEFLEGVKVTQVADVEVRRRLARTLLASFVQQVLEHGLFHADPHPGNLLATPAGELALLDLGAVGTLSDATRASLVRLAAAATARDRPAFARALLELVDAPIPPDPARWQSDVGELLDALRGRAARGPLPMAEVAGRLFDLVRTHGLRIRAEAFALVRATTLVDGVLRELDPRLDPLRAAAIPVLRATGRRRDWDSASLLAANLLRARWHRSLRFRAAVIAGTAAVALAVTGLAVLAVWSVLAG